MSSSLGLFSCLILWGCMLCACSSTEGYKVDNPFPERRELQQLGKKTPDRMPSLTAGLPVEAMTLLAPLYEQIGATTLTPTSPLEGHVTQGLTPTKAILTRESSCIARQYAAFRAVHEDLPYRKLQAFIRHRCGSTLTAERATWWTFRRENKQGLSQEAHEQNVREGIMANQSFLDDVKQSTTSWLETYPQGTEVGVALAQVGDVAVVVLVYGKPDVLLADAPIFPDKHNTVTIRGTSTKPGESVYGMITHGEFGYEGCITDDSVKMPNFAITCPTMKREERHRLLIFLSEKGSVFSNSIHDQSVWPRAGALGTLPPSEYLSTTTASFTAADNTLPVPEQALFVINQARDSARRAPVTLSPAQSAMNTQLAPHLFEALRTDDLTMQREVTMGVKAGWEVQGPVVDGNMMVFYFSEDHILPLVEEMMDLPHGRRFLFGQDTKKLAMGLVADEDGDLGTLASVYDFLPKQSNAKRVARVWTRLQRARKINGYPRLKRASRLIGKRQELAKELSAGESTLKEVADELAQEVVWSYGKGVDYFTFAVHDLDNIQFGKNLLSIRGRKAMVFVAPYNQKGYPWTIYGVVIVFI